MSLQIHTTRIERDVAVVALSGSILLWPEGQIDFIRKLIDRHEKKVIFDLTGLEHMDSSGVELMVECYNALGNAGSELRFANAQPRVARLFQVTKLDTIFPMFPTVESARESFSETSDGGSAG